MEGTDIKIARARILATRLGATLEKFLPLALKEYERMYPGETMEPYMASDVRNALDDLKRFRIAEKEWNDGS